MENLPKYQLAEIQHKISNEEFRYILRKSGTSLSKFLELPVVVANQNAITKSKIKKHHAGNGGEVPPNIPTNLSAILIEQFGESSIICARIEYAEEHDLDSIFNIKKLAEEKLGGGNE